MRNYGSRTVLLVLGQSHQQCIPGRFFFLQAEGGIRDGHVTGVQTCALPISAQWLGKFCWSQGEPNRLQVPYSAVRSEERRVGKEGISKWSAWHCNKKGTDGSW